MANENRGEVEFDLADVKFTARPTFALVAEIESATRKSMFQLLGAALAKTLPMTEIVIIASLAAQFSEDRPDEVKKDVMAFREKLFQYGAGNLMDPVGKLINNILMTGSKRKNAKAGSDKT